MEKKILVVDDDPELRQLLHEYFGGWGYSVLLASDGAQMWEQLGRQTVDLAGQAAHFLVRKRCDARLGVGEAHPLRGELRPHLLALQERRYARAFAAGERGVGCEHSRVHGKRHANDEHCGNKALKTSHHGYSAVVEGPRSLTSPS